MTSMIVRVRSPMSIPNCNGTVQCPQNIGKQSDAIPFVVLAHPLEMVSVALENIGEKVVALVEVGHAIVAALDVMLTRAWQ